MDTIVLSDKYLQAINLIQKEQSKIIGSGISKIILENVEGLKMEEGNPQIEGDPKEILSNLVNQYSTLFGKASIIVSKEAIKKVNPSFSSDELPDNLK